MLTWIFLLKKCHMEIKLGKHEFHTWAYQAQVPCNSLNALFYPSMVLELTKLEFLVIWNSSLLRLSSLFFLFFFFNQQININIKISSFFFFIWTHKHMFFIYLIRSIVKYRNFNFKIWIFRPLIPLVHSFLTHSSISNFSEALWSYWFNIGGYNEKFEQHCVQREIRAC